MTSEINIRLNNLNFLLLN